MRVIVTRPAAQAADFVAELAAAGVDAVALPLIDIEPVADRAPVVAAWSELPRTDWVMFVSANAVQAFFSARPGGATWPDRLRAGATGPGTVAALRAAGVPPSHIDAPPLGGPYDTDTLWRQLAHADWAGRRVKVVRGEDGRDWLAQQLAQAGATVGFVAAYRRVAPRWTSGMRQQVEQARQAPDDWCWHFSSSEAVGHLCAAWPGTSWSACLAVATHPRIAARVREAGFGRVDPVQPGADAVARWLHGDGAARRPGPPGVASGG